MAAAKKKIKCTRCKAEIDSVVLHQTYTETMYLSSAYELGIQTRANFLAEQGDEPYDAEYSTPSGIVVTDSEDGEVLDPNDSDILYMVDSHYDHLIQHDDGSGRELHDSEFGCPRCGHRASSIDGVITLEDDLEDLLSQVLNLARGG